MGLFFNYDKPGKGIEKDAPKKKGIFLYLELLWRKLGKLILSNMLYFILSIPVMLVYHFLVFSTMSAAFPGNVGTGEFVQLSFITTIVLTVLYGSGPISCGYTFLMRSYAREEHVWLTSDFFQKCRENFKQSIIIFIIDLLVLFLVSNAAVFYGSLYRIGHQIGLYMMTIILICAMLYTFMHYYIYQFTITFDIKLRDIFKNSLIMSIASLPMNLFLTAFIVIASFMILINFTTVGIGLLSFICFISFMRFPIDFYVSRIIKRRLIDTQTPEESDE